MLTGDFGSPSSNATSHIAVDASASSIAAAVIALLTWRSLRQALAMHPAGVRNLTGIQLCFLVAILPPRPLALLAVWTPLAAVILVEFAGQHAREAYFAADPAYFGYQPPVNNVWWLSRGTVHDREPSMLATVIVSLIAGVLLGGVIGTAVVSALLPREVASDDQQAAAVIGVIVGVAALTTSAGVVLARRRTRLMRHGLPVPPIPFSTARPVAMDAPDLPPLAAVTTTAQPLISADGATWWDGQTWRPVPPPGAPLSDDGFYWWDGGAWRPLPESMTTTPVA